MSKDASTATCAAKCPLFPRTGYRSKARHGCLPVSAVLGIIVGIGRHTEACSLVKRATQLVHVNVLRYDQVAGTEMQREKHLHPSRTGGPGTGWEVRLMPTSVPPGTISNTGTLVETPSLHLSCTTPCQCDLEQGFQVQRFFNPHLFFSPSNALCLLLRTIFTLIQ